MEVYLIQDKDRIQFPIIPSTISVNGGANMDTSNIINLGEIGIFGGKKLRTMELTSFFPKQDYNITNWKNIPDPYVFVRKIEKWKNKGNILRITVTDGVANFECKISDFTYSEQDGTRDVYFELSLVEHIRISIPNSLNSSSSSNSSNRPSTPPPQKTHKVVKGDNMWDLSKKYYGKGSDYKKINEKNWNKYPSLKKNNLIYVGWVLVL